MTDKSIIKDAILRLQIKKFLRKLTLLLSFDDDIHDAEVKVYHVTNRYYLSCSNSMDDDFADVIYYSIYYLSGAADGRQKLVLNQEMISTEEVLEYFKDYNII